jgi:hypothetical protein
MPKSVDLIGKTFGIATVLERLGKDRAGGWTWRCRCSCGTEFVRNSGYLKQRKSCGCLARTEPAKALGRIPHGMSGSPEFSVWSGVRERCFNEKNPAFHYYGGRGITMCREWAESFPAFLADMGTRPSPRHTLDRIDNSRGYEPGNCRWATQEEQANNRRSTVKIEHDGEVLSVAQWAKRFGLPKATLWGRLREGVPFKEAVRQHQQTLVTAPGGESKTVPEWAEVLGITRTSAYRLHREGKLVPRLPAADIVNLY